MPVKVRAFKDSDAESVRTMMAALAQQREESTHQVVLRDSFHRFFPAYMKGLLENPDAFVRVAEDAGKVVGYAVAMRGRDQPFLKYNRVALLNDVYVVDSHRSKGVGRLLLDAVRAWGKKQGLDAIEVHVFPEHEEELQALEKLGFFRSRIKLLCPLDDEKVGRA
jgi:GNAT superfamily N-acetyltransferase